MLTFNYGAMNSGKTASLLHLAHSYEENWLYARIFAYRNEHVKSRAGMSQNAIPYDEEFNFYKDIRKTIASAVFVDEAQFLTHQQVAQLCCVSDHLRINVYCYGLRSDFMGHPFEGSSYLMALADRLIEIHSVTPENENASMQIRLDRDGNRVYAGPKIDIGHHYKSVSRKEFQLHQLYGIKL